MPDTSGSSFFPSTLHNITPERVVFVYNNNVAGSRDVALAYQQARELPDDNLIDLNITAPIPGETGLDAETPLSYADFTGQIEDPLRSALSELGVGFDSSGIGDGSIWVIILGFGIPTSFLDVDGTTIAVASALHRLGKSNSDRKSPNHTFNRAGDFKFFDEEDASEVLITAIIDGPTSESAIALINRSVDVDNQTFISGEIFVDPYGLKETEDQIEFQSDILDFISNEAPNLGMPVNSTVDIDNPYLEPTVASFFKDSFYWGWFNPTYSKNLFFNQNQRRVFLYNADDRSASNIHYYDSDRATAFDVNGSDLWCNVAVNIDPGYASCAGSVDEVGEDAYLIPRPFFESLHRGATLGEAFLFASKFVNWKTVLIGDPLMVVNFPSDLPSSQDTSNTTISNKEAIIRIKNSYEESIAWANRQSRLTSSILETIVDSTNLSEEVYLLEAVNKLNNLKSEINQINLMAPAIDGWLSFILKTTRMNLEEWLDSNNENITHFLNEVIRTVASTSVAVTYEYPEGEWEYIFVYNHILLTFENVHFNLQIAADEYFSDIVVDVSTLLDIEGWKYEREKFSFVQMPDSGFPSNFSGRRIKFISPSDNYLNRTELYYVRWRALDEDGVRVFPISDSYQVDSNPIIIAR